jgi:PEP-CTERM motif
MRLKLAAAAFVAALSVTPAFAEILNFSWEYAPGEVATWSQSSNPIPIAVDPGQLSRVTVNGGMTTGFMSFSVVDFDSEAGNGGLIIGNIDVESTGVQIYTGSEAAPIFSPGQYLVETVGTGDEAFVVVTAATPAVPEPSTWAMMLIGFAGLGYAGHRASRKSAALAA